MAEKEGWHGVGWKRGNGEVGIIFCINYKLFADEERSLPRMCESCFSRPLKIWMLYPTLPSLFSLVKPRPNHKPPCVISQQCFWPPGLMAQCSLYDMYCLKGRSALLFSSNLIPKLFKHQGFLFKYGIKSVCYSPCVRERPTVGLGKYAWSNILTLVRTVLPLFCSVFISLLCRLCFFKVPLAWTCKGHLKMCYCWEQIRFTCHPKWNNLFKRVNFFLWQVLSIKLLLIVISLSRTCLLCVWKDINHNCHYLCGHCGSLQAASWDTNRPSGCWINAFELLAWLKIPVHFCVN